MKPIQKNELVTMEKVDIRLPDVNWTKELKLVKDIVAKNCSETEFRLLCYMAQQYSLNPLKKEIWAVKYEGKPSLIFVGRDGLLSIAHRSKQFGSMETSCEIDKATGKPISATCIIYRKDYDKPFKNTVYFDEYNLRQALWLTKPKVMLMKVAESTTLRRAFNIDGLLTPEEISEEGAENGKNKNNGNDKVQ